MSKVGISAGIRGGAPIASLRENLEQLVAIGFDAVELNSRNLNVSIAGRQHPERLARLKAAIAGLPLTFTLHGSEVASSRGGNLFDTTTTAERQIFASDLELAGEIGAKVLVYHSGTTRDPYPDDRAFTHGLLAERAALREFGDRAAELGVTIAVENRDPVARYIIRRAYGFDLLRLAEQIEAVDHPNVKICFDTGHAFLSYTYLGKGVEGYLADITAIAPLIGHLHITDNMGQVQLDSERDQGENLIAGDGDLHLLPGWGAIPFDEIFAIPFPLQPIANLEIKPIFFEHLDEAYATVARLWTNAPAAVTTG
jgi:sugar phosphate isomerase/epimerase